MKKIVNIAEIWEKARAHRVEPVEGKDGYYQVFSASGGIYDVVISGRDIRSCNCENGQHTDRSGCSHVLAAARLRALELGYVVEPYAEDDPVWEELDRDALFRLGQGVVLVGLALTRWDGERVVVA